MTTQSALLMLSTETPLHAGAGQSVAGIDLPIQREVHTQWPCVYGSAVKGALRARAFHDKMDNGDLIELFGPEHAAAAGERDNSHAGALLVGDARLLLLPVRSLQSCFKWVTCPAILRRFWRDAERLGMPLPPLQLPAIDPTGALAASKGNLFLEEFRLEAEPNALIEQLASQLDALCQSTPAADDLKERLVIVHDDIFSFLARNATAINAHIAIDAASKTVKDTALWYEETLPPESLLYVPLTATASRRKGSQRQPGEMLNLFSGLLQQRPWLQLGGNETTGMGWCRAIVKQGQ
ncbi:type III-B CRISPR module RAMP protein Cmr4 [Azotobacter salinestris]|uniref:type III-B CRISPR module RAMP protein Cmr4 n=1 Tax=Azotobacter salinestris TaxID=69964 RepID=UPI0032DEECB9